MNTLSWLADNWYLVLAGMAGLVAVIYLIVRFATLPKHEQVVKIKEWLLWAVTCAEEELGGGTGVLKLRMVYDMFVTAWPWVARYISFEAFSGWVDEALERMRHLLTQNAAVAALVLPLEELAIGGTE